MSPAPPLASARSRLATVRDTGRTIWARSHRADVPLLAAALAHFGLISLVPLVTLALVVASIVAPGSLTGSATAVLGPALSSSGEALLTDALTGGAGRGGATVVGVLVLLWSGSRVFRGLDAAVGRIQGPEQGNDTRTPEAEQSEPSTKRGRRRFGGRLHRASDTIAVLGTMLVAVIGVAVGTAALATVGLPVGLDAVVLPLAVVVVLLPVFTILPDPPLPVRDALPGALVTAVGWGLLATGIRVYVQVAGGFSAYGALGGVLLLVTWLYAAAFLLLLGVAVNATLAAADSDDQGDSA